MFIGVPVSSESTSAQVAPSSGILLSNSAECAAPLPIDGNVYMGQGNTKDPTPCLSN